MIETKRKPASVGEVLTEEFLAPLGLTQGALAAAMGVPRKLVNELSNHRRAVTVDTALMLARVFGTSADFWLNTQRRTDLWEPLHTPARRHRIERAQALYRFQNGCTPKAVPSSGIFLKKMPPCTMQQGHGNSGAGLNRVL